MRPANGDWATKLSSIAARGGASAGAASADGVVAGVGCNAHWLLNNARGATVALASGCRPMMLMVLDSSVMTLARKIITCVSGGMFPRFTRVFITAPTVVSSFTRSVVGTLGYSILM